MKVPLVDLQAQYLTIKDEIDRAVAATINSGQFILGPEVKAFEEEMAAYLGVRYAVGVASGTDALHLALLSCEIGPGDEVITTPFTFIATVDTIMQCGAVPVLVDIDPETYNIDAVKIESKITKKTKAILPVHLYGQPADLEPITELVKKHGLLLIEDCAQALGAEYKGKKVGSIGDAACLSFFPSKALGAYGDGGMVVTDNPEIAGKVDMLRRHGARVAYYHSLLGFNSRLDALQAAVLRVKHKHLDEWNELRCQKAQLYKQQLEKIEGITLQKSVNESLHSYNYYTIRIEKPGIDRNAMRKHLEAKGISTAVYYPLSLHLQEVCKPLGYKAGDFPHSELAQEQVLSLPMYPELSKIQIDYVIEIIKGNIAEVQE